MQLLVRIVLGYILAATVLVAVFRDDPALLLGKIASSVPASVQTFASMNWWIAPIIVGVALTVPLTEMSNRLANAVLAIFASIAFLTTFTMVKSTLPFIVPFWADPVFARLDEVIHLGHAPWEIAYQLAPWIHPQLATRIYLEFWMPVAMFLPVFLFLFDSDAARVRRFILLYAFSWIVIGNFIALTFMSAGPVYYDRLLGAEDFAGLHIAMTTAGIGESFTGMMHEALWNYYVTLDQSLGSGISAFPSVHVAVATVFALYLYERWRGFLPLSLALVAIYLFLSVYLGWHYAIDGYASIALVTTFWAYLRRRAKAGASAEDPRCTTTPTGVQPAE